MLTSDKQVTLFATCKPFSGATGVMQTNALRSWQALGYPIILFGDEDGVAEIAALIGAKHVKHVDRNEKGTPLINSLFDSAKHYGDTRYFAYLNADIILTDRFQIAVERLIENLSTNDAVLMTARRQNIPLQEPLFDQEVYWKDKLFEIVDQFATWDVETAIDLFFFDQNTLTDLMPFAIGRMQWDNWLLWKAHTEGAKIIDASMDMDLYHPIHGYASTSTGWLQITQGDEASYNRKIAQNCSMHLKEACSHVIEDGVLKVINEACLEQQNKKYKLDEYKHVKAVIAQLCVDVEKVNIIEIADCLRGLLHKLKAYSPNTLPADFNFQELNDFLSFMTEGFIDDPVNRSIHAIQDFISRDLLSRVSIAQEQDRPILIWGGGAFGKMACQLFKRHNVQITGFIDKDPNKKGNLILGIPIIASSLNELDNLKKLPYVVIGSSFAAEIQEELEGNGYQYLNDFFN
ncbi:nucleoside-diphosphate sugar epimerase/dehydratase [Curvivirga aplysinae]|uniref:nucleoside-diphosphate sugar epimerase/dehydratase n=1 Tax=Curvivirga aplysinae TaxID=2529852 RepID=UPI0012BC9F21|nr:hypothetical protein [Curvivirga aplysinae]MTI08926.1 hypothetical protein [Curvivirga aplysinae]